MPKVLTTPPVEATMQNVERAIDEIASLVGAPYDPEVRDRALRALDRAATRLNMAGVYLTNIREYSASFTASKGFVNISAATNWGWPYGRPRAMYVSGTSCQVASELRWLPWDRFKRLDTNMSAGATTFTNAKPSTTTGAGPLYCAIQSDVFDKKLYFYPVAPSSVTKITKVIIPYFARIQRPSEESTLTVNDEVFEALVTGGSAIMMQQRYASNPQIWQPYMADFERALARLRASAYRLNAEGDNFQIEPQNPGQQS